MTPVSSEVCWEAQPALGLLIANEISGAEVIAVYIHLGRNGNRWIHCISFFQDQVPIISPWNWFYSIYAKTWSRRSRNVLSMDVRNVWCCMCRFPLARRKPLCLSIKFPQSKVLRVLSESLLWIIIPCLRHQGISWHLAVPLLTFSGLIYTQHISPFCFCIKIQSMYFWHVRLICRVFGSDRQFTTGQKEDTLD